MTKWFLKIRFVKAFIGMVMISILLSLFFTMSLLFIIGREISAAAIYLSVGIPAIIAGIFSVITLKAIHELEQAEQKLKGNSAKLTL